MTLGSALTRKPSIAAFDKFVAHTKTTKYSYEETIYIDNTTKVTITCPTHGNFEQQPDNHRNGQGCPKCKFDKLIGIRKDTAEDFIHKALLVHGSKYDYSNVVYTLSVTPVEIICPLHGSFLQKPVEHLTGRGCRKCAIQSRTEKNKWTNQEFIKKASEVHNNKYDYSQVEYSKMHNKIKIICSVHGEFFQKAANHIQGQGCPSCGNIQKLKKYHEHPTILYMLFFKNLNLYKLGITMEKRGLTKRYSHEKEKYEICQQVLFNKGEDAYQLEQALLNKYKQWAYVGPNILQAGNTELFTKNILLDYFKPDKKL